MAATSSSFAEDGTTELVFADGVVTRVPSAIVYDRLGDPVPVAAVVKNIAAQAITAGTPVSLWTPATGKKFRVLGFALSLSVAGSVILKDNTTEILRTPLLAAGVGLASPPMGLGILSSTVNNALQLDASVTGSVSGFVFGVEE